MKLYFDKAYALDVTNKIDYYGLLYESAENQVLLPPNNADAENKSSSNEIYRVLLSTAKNKWIGV